MREDTSPTDLSEPLEPIGARLLVAARWLLGGTTLVVGFVWLLSTYMSPSAGRDLSIGAVLLLGSLVILMPHRIALPTTKVTVTAVAAVAVAGTLGGLAVKSTRAACMFCYLVFRGWPFSWAGRGGDGETPEEAKRLAEAANWDVDLIHVAADLLLWSYAALIVLAVATRVVSGRRGGRGPR